MVLAVHYCCVSWEVSNYKCDGIMVGIKGGIMVELKQKKRVLYENVFAIKQFCVSFAT